jgi:hypothetical protein
MIPTYRRITGAKFPIYADPTRRLYKALGMSWTFNFGPRCDYMPDISVYTWMLEQAQQFLQEENDLKLKGGNILWVGGEFMFRKGGVVWCRRMKNYRGHSDIATIKGLLGVNEELSTDN